MHLAIFNMPLRILVFFFFRVRPRIQAFPHARQALCHEAVSSAALGTLAEILYVSET